MSSNDDATSGGPADPRDADLLRRVRARVMSAITEPVGDRHTTVRAGSGEWQRIAPGLERKVLFQADGAVSALLRLAPGGSIPPHDHAIHEECLVLEGTVLIGEDLALHPGDFHVGLRGLRHPGITSPTGATVLLRTAA